MMVAWGYLALKLVHVFAMALWTGGPYIALVGVRASFAEGGAVALAALHRLQAMTRLFIAAALVTVLSGGALIAIAGGPRQVPGRILVGAGLALVLFFVGGGMNRPALSRLEAHFKAGGSAIDALPHVRRFFVAARIEDGLRAIILMLMVLPLF